MAQMAFRRADISWNHGPDNNGTIKGSAKVSFSTNVIDATAAIQDFLIQTDKDRHVHVIGASIISISDDPLSTVVEVEASLTFSDNSKHYIDQDNSIMSVVVIAWCE